MFSRQYNGDVDYVRTLLGTAYAHDKSKLEGEPPKDIYTFTRYKTSKYITAREKLFDFEPVYSTLHNGISVYYWGHATYRYAIDRLASYAYRLYVLYHF